MNGFTRLIVPGTHGLREETDAEFKARIARSYAKDAQYGVPQVAKPDPWIKVGTTTIDGTFADVVALFDDANMVDEKANVFLIRGQHVKKREHCATSLATMRCEVMVVGCDIVRRQSEIDAEHLHAQMNALAEHKDMVAKAFAKPCPECGPHGNRGEVLLASSWAKCTTCNGGKAGDLWGGVEASAEDPGFVEWDTGFDARKVLPRPLTGAEYAAASPFMSALVDMQRDACAQMGVPKDILFGTQPSGFQIPTMVAQREYMARRFNGRVVIDHAGTVATIKDGKVVSIDGAY